MIERDQEQGFSNAFTAVAVRHIDNTRWFYTLVTGVIEEQEDEQDMADYLSEVFEERIDGMGEGLKAESPAVFYTDLLRSAFAQVNWLEIVQTYRRRVAEGRE